MPARQVRTQQYGRVMMFCQFVIEDADPVISIPANVAIVAVIRTIVSPLSLSTMTI